MWKHSEDARCKFQVPNDQIPNKFQNSMTEIFKTILDRDHLINYEDSQIAAIRYIYPFKKISFHSN